MTTLRRQMRTTKINISVESGVRIWASRMEDFQSHLPLMPWEQGENMAKRDGSNYTGPPLFKEHEPQQLLDDNPHPSHIQELTNLDWDIPSKDYKEHISKLESLEPSII